MAAASTSERIKEFILAEFLEGESPDSLDDGTPLLSSGIIGSVATLRLITFLEEHFGISIAPDEVGEDSMNTIAAITQLVQSKLRAS
jgi:acyl carrier protein